MKYIAIIIWWALCLSIVIPIHFIYCRIVVTILVFLWDGTLLKPYWGGITYDTHEPIKDGDTYTMTQIEKNMPYKDLFIFWKFDY